MEKDLRLKNTTNTQYRIYSDSQTLLVPKGESITMPLQPEHVSANVQITGAVKKGYFGTPRACFTNTYDDKKYFDCFDLAIARQASDLPVNDPTVDYAKDLKLTKLKTLIECNILVADNTVVGGYSGYLEFNYIAGSDFWVSNYTPCNIGTGSPINVTGQVVFATKDVFGNVDKFLTSGFLQNGNNNMRVYACFDDLYYNTLSSRYHLTVRNQHITRTNTVCSITILGGE